MVGVDGEEEGGGSGLVAGRTEKRLFAGWRDARREEALFSRDKRAGRIDMRRFIAGGVDGGARDARRDAACFSHDEEAGRKDMRRFIADGVATVATDARRKAAWFRRVTGAGRNDMRRSAEGGVNRDASDPGGVRLAVPALRRGGAVSGGVASRDCSELTARRKSASDVSSRAGCMLECVTDGYSGAVNRSPILLALCRFFRGCLIRAAAS
jgi:hypothetical protein